jgi:hypothetical protein
MRRARQPVTTNSLKSDVAAGPVEIDPLYLFLCAVGCPDVRRSGDPKRRSRSLEEMLTRGSTWKGSSFRRFPLTQQ